MANQTEYVASIGLDLAALEREIGEARQKLAKMGSGVPTTGIDSFLSSAAAKFKKFGEGLEKVGTSMTVGITAPLALLGKQIVEIGFSYEKAMNTFQAVTKATADEMSRAAAVAEKLGADMTLPATSAADAALAMVELSKGGFTAAQAMDAAKGALQLAAAAGIDEARAAEITANALNIFHLSASEAGRVSDLLAGASAAASGEITDMANAMQQSGSSAAALGVPIEDLTTAISEMAKNGILGSDAGTSLKTMFAALTPKTKDASAAMKELGIDAFDAQGNFVGLETVIAQAQPALARMTAEQRAFAIEAAFGSDAQRAANIVLGQGVDAWNTMSAAVGQSGTAAELAAAKTKGLSGAWDGLMSQLETLGLKVFKSASGGLEGLIRKIADAVQGISELDSSVLRAGVTFATVAGTAGPLALLGSKLLEFGPKGAVMAVAIAGVAAIATAYDQDFAKMEATLDSFAGKLTETFTGAKAQGDDWEKMWRQLGIVAASGLDIALSHLNGVLIGMKTIGAAMVAFISGNWDQIGGIVTNGVDKIKEVNDDFWNRTKDRNEQMWALQQAGWEKYYAVLALQSSEGGKKANSSFVEGLNADISAAQKQSRFFGSGLGDSIINGLSSSLQRGRPQITGDIESLVTGGVGPTKWRAAGRDGVAEPFKLGVKESWFKSPHFIIHWLQDAADYANNESPTEFAKAGSKMGEKLKAGFQAALGNINDFLGRAFGGTGTISDSVFDLMLRKMPQVATALRDQARAYSEVQKAMELYSVMTLTVEGENTKFVKTVTEAINKITAADAALRSTITPAMADLAGKIQHVTIVTKEMGDAIAKSVGGLVEMTIAAKNAAFGGIASLVEATIKASNEQKKHREFLIEMNETLSRQLPESWNILIEGIVAGSGKVGDAIYEMSVKVKGWAVDILGVVDTLPGHFGDAARKILSTVDQWVQFANKVLAVLNRMNSSIPGSIGDIVTKITGIFKKTTDTAKTASEDWAGYLNDMSETTEGCFGKIEGSAKKGMAGFLDTIKGGLGFATGLFGSFMTGLGVANSSGSKTKGAIMGGLTGALSGAATGAAWGAAGGPIGAGIGAAIGAGVGIIGGLFGGGKSKEQKAAEEAAKQKAGLDMQKLAADIMSSQMEGLKKGLELLEGLKTFSEVPRKAIKRFFNEIELILTLFADMAGKFKAESIEKSKAVTEMMGDSFGALLTGADLINAIKGVATITDQNIADFVSTTVKIAEKWGEAAGQIEMQTAKFTGKISDKLKTSFEFLSIVPDVIKGFSESKPLDDSIISSVFSSLQKIVQKMKEVSEAERGLELNKAGASAGIFATIIESTKGLVEVLTSLSTYKAIEDATLNLITSDLQKLLAWGDGLISLAESGITKFETLQDVIGRLGVALKGAASGISGLAGGSGITASITSGAGASLIQRQAPTASPAAPSQPVTVVVNVAGSVISEGELLKKTREEVEKALELRQRRLALASRS